MIKGHDFWKFTHFTSEAYKYRERWDRDNPILKEELMMLAYNIDPLLHNQSMPKSTHFGSANAWYMYKRFNIWQEKDVSKSWLIEVHPTAENMDKPYSRSHMKFEVMKPNA